LFAAAALQAIVTVAAIVALSGEFAPDQRVIARCARHEQDFFQNELAAAKARLLY
jgi:hypothetical protein